MDPLRLLFGVLLVAGCAATERSTGPTGFDGTAWILADLGGAPPGDGPAPTLHFATGRIDGSDGCNRYGGPYSATGDRFVLTGQLATTQMACPEATMQRAQLFQAALTRATRARTESGRLVLSDANGSVLATFTAQPQTLAGTAWQVTGYNNGRQAVTSALARSMLTIAFSRDGRISGSAGCNRYTGTIVGALPDVRIDSVGITRMMCADPKVMEQERLFVAALGRVARGRIDGDRLELRSADGALQVTAREAEPEPSNAAAPKSSEIDPAVAAATLPGASAVPASASESAAVVDGLRLPASFRGDLPCADCEAIRTQLDLWPDHVFHVHREWLGTDVVRDAIGRWRTEPQRRAIVLDLADGGPSQYEIVGANALRQLDMQGRPIVSKLPYELVSAGAFAPADVSLTLGGEMRYMADAARFTECLTGRSYPIAMEGDFRALERAYVASASAPGAALYVTFDGTIAPRPKMEGAGTEATVIVRRFVTVLPDRGC